MSKQEIFYIEEEDVPEEFLGNDYSEDSEDDDLPDNEYTTFIEDWLKENNHQPKRGDAILVRDAPRNDNRVFWDGSKVINQEYQLDDYGNVPLGFSFPEFSISYFKDCENHNCFTYLNLEAVNLKVEDLTTSLIKVKLSDLFLEKNYNDDTFKEVESDIDIQYKTFVYQGETYYIVFGSDSDPANLDVIDGVAIFNHNLYGDEYHLINNPEETNNHIFFI